MDDLLNMYTDEQLISELEKGHYWYYEGNFYSNGKRLMTGKPTSVENAVYSRFYCF